MADLDPQAMGDEAPQDWGDFVGAWLTAIEASSDEERKWRERDADKAVKAYRGGSDAPMASFNLWYSNVETMVPALYNSTPAPDVRRRYGDEDDVAKNAGDVIERALAYMVDVYDFDATIISAVRDLVVVGRGVVRIRYDGNYDEQGLIYEDLRCEYVPWRSFRHGQARVWDEVTWIAFELFLSRDQIDTMTQSDGGAASIVEGWDSSAIDYPYSPAGTDSKGSSEPRGPAKRARVWEVWDKEARKVYFISDSYKDAPLRVLDDPLELEGFFPIPRPMTGSNETGSLIPVTLYSINERVFDDLDKVNSRLRNLIGQVRPRGAYAGSGDLQRIVEADDGELVPVDVASDLAMIQTGGIDKLIAWFPLDPTIQAITVLSNHAELLKQHLYEVTGLSDIIRGASNPNETATAQNIKNQWGSIRIQRLQSEVQRFVRDLFRLKGEIIAEQFAPETLQMMTGIEVTQEIAGFLTNETARGFRIDIESDSTVRGDLTRNQQQISDFMQGASQFLQVLPAAVQQKTLTPKTGVELFAAFARNFKLGKQAEDAIDSDADLIRSGQYDPMAEAKQAEEQNQQMAAEQRALEREKFEAEKVGKLGDFLVKWGELGLKYMEKGVPPPQLPQEFASLVGAAIEQPENAEDQQQDAMQPGEGGMEEMPQDGGQQPMSGQYQ